MKTIFTVDDVHPRDRLAYWYDVAKDVYVGHSCIIEKGAPLRVAIEAESLAYISVSILRSDSARFIRSAQDVLTSSDSDCFFCVQLEGHVIWRQDGRDEMSRPGDLVLMDPRRPYELIYCDAGRLLILKVPRRQIEQRIGPTIGLTAVPVRGDDGIGALMSGFLRMLPDRLPLADDGLQERLANHVLDLAAMALLAQIHRGGLSLSSAKTLALASLRSAIDRNLGDPQLDSETVAHAAGISVRYASQLLSEEGTTIQRQILTRRLEQCRRLLADPAQAHRSIIEIAMSWGFSDASHFGRRFREAFGVSPRDYRAATPRQDK